VSRKTIFRWLLGFAIFLFPFSLAFVAFGLLPPSWKFSNAIVIAIHALVLLLWMMEQQSTRSALVNFIGVILFSLVIESIGVSSGFPFGKYQYTTLLGTSFLGVPLIITLAWYSTVAGALGVARNVLRFNINLLVVSLIAAFFVVALDIVLEPMATHVNHYWIWEKGEIPLVNYSSWFILAFIVIFFLGRPKLDVKTYSFTPALIYGMEWVLFALTDLKHGFVMPVAASFLIILSSLLFARKVSQ